jgi:hypothetical protein
VSRIFLKFEFEIKIFQMPKSCSQTVVPGTGRRTGIDKGSYRYGIRPQIVLVEQELELKKTVPWRRVKIRFGFRAIQENPVLDMTAFSIYQGHNK